MWHDAKKVFGAQGEELVIPVPREGNNYVAVIRLTGFGTATIDAEDGDPSGGFSDATIATAVGGTVSGGDATADGIYTVDITDGADFFKLVVDAYTAGSIVAEVALVPDVS